MASRRPTRSRSCVGGAEPRSVTAFVAGQAGSTLAHMLLTCYQPKVTCRASLLRFSACLKDPQ